MSHYMCGLFYSNSRNCSEHWTFCTFVRLTDHWYNKYIGLPYCRAEMYAGRVTCYPLMSRGEYVDGTDGWTPLCFPLDTANIIAKYHSWKRVSK